MVVASSWNLYCWVLVLVLVILITFDESRLMKTTTDAFSPPGTVYRCLSSREEYRIVIRQTVAGATSVTGGVAQDIDQKSVLPSTTPDELKLNNDSDGADDDERDELVDSVTSKLDDMEGLWYSDDFYGSHGREWVKVSATIVPKQQQQQTTSSVSVSSALVAVKITGDPNIPAGCVTFQTESWPAIGSDKKVAAQIQIRADPNNPQGYSWIPGTLTLLNTTTILLVCYYNRSMKNSGLFYKEKEEHSKSNAGDDR